MSGRPRTYGRGGWRDGEVWLEDEVDWFSSLSRSVTPAVPSTSLLATAGVGALPLPGIGRPRGPRDAEREREVETGRWAERRRRLATRFLPALALLAAAASAPVLVPRVAGLQDEPPAPASVVVASAALAASTPFWLAPPPVLPAVVDTPEAVAAFESLYPEISWRRSQSVGLPYAGRLAAGVQLPVEGWDWVTWDPVRNRVPNRAERLYGTDALVRTVLAVIADYRREHPGAPRVVVGDLSLRGGGEIDEHSSHESGLDVDVYYPRKDGSLAAPTNVAQVDLPLAQELVDRFVAAGATLVLVGYSTPLDGPAGVVMPYSNHDNHMHVRIAPPAASR